MRDAWLPWSAASLASGAVLLVMAALALPPSPDLTQLLTSVVESDAKWLMAAAGFFLASVGLVMGLPTIIWVLPPRYHRAGMTGLWIWSLGMIGLTGLAALLVLLRALENTITLTPAQVEELGQDVALTVPVLGFLGAFYIGELIVAVVLLRGGGVGRWIPVLMLLHVAMLPINPVVPYQLQAVQVIVLGIALMGVAVKASESWAAVRRPVSL